MLNSGKNWWFCCPRDLEIWWMTLKNNRALLLYYIKLCAAFQSHWHIIKLELQSGSAQFASKLAIFCPGWLWKLTYDLEKQQGTSSILCQALCIISNPLVKSTWVTAWKCSSRVKIGIFFVPHDLEIWHMTLKNNRTPLLCCFNLCASFHSKWWIQTGVTVRKRPIWVKIDDFFSMWPWNLTDDLEEQ